MNIDLALKGSKPIQETILQLQNELDKELSLPYFFDLVNQKTVQSGNLV